MKNFSIFTVSMMLMLVSVSVFASGGKEDRTLSLYAGWNAQSPDSFDGDHFPYTGVEAGVSYRVHDGSDMDVLFRGHYDRTWPGDYLFEDYNIRNTVLLGPEFLYTDSPLGFAVGVGWRLLENFPEGNVNVNQYGIWGEIFTYNHLANDSTFVRLDPYLGVKLIGGFGASLGIRLRLQPY